MFTISVVTAQATDETLIGVDPESYMANSSNWNSQSGQWRLPALWRAAAWTSGPIHGVARELGRPQGPATRVYGFTP